MAAVKVLSDVRGLDFAEESTFSTDPGSHTAIRAFDIEFEPARRFHDVMHAKSEAFRGPDARVPGGKGGSLRFKMYLRSKSGTESAALSLMKRCGATLASCAAKASKVTGGTGSTITLLDADASDISVGMAVYHIPASGTNSVRFVKRKQSSGGTTTLTLNAATTTTPTNGDSLAAIDTITPTAGDPAKTFSFCVYVGDSAGDTIKWTLTGCTGRWSLDTIEAGALPVVSFEFQVDSYSYSTGSLTQSADTMDAARPVLGDKLYYGGSAVDIRSLSFDPRLEFGAIDATSGSNGRQGWTFFGTSPAATITPLYDSAHLDDLEACTMRDAMFESTYSSTSAWAWWISGAYIDEAKAQNSNGLVRNEISLVGRDPGKNADGTAYPIWALAVTK